VRACVDDDVSCAVVEVKVHMCTMLSSSGSLHSGVGELLSNKQNMFDVRVCCANAVRRCGAVADNWHADVRANKAHKRTQADDDTRQVRGGEVVE
jgi:hypothetical protein